MERILRGIIQVGQEPDTEEAHANWLKLQDYELQYPSEEDKKIFNYIKLFYSQMSAPPDFNLVKEYFEKENDIESVSRLEEIGKAALYIRTNYLSIVRSVVEQQQIKNFAILCRDASAIAENGRVVQEGYQKKTLKGIHDAVDYVYGNLHEFTRVESGEKLEGVITEDADEVVDEYDHIASTDKLSHRNLLGLEPVDQICKGHRKGELWVHTAFTGELKTSLALNYAYNNSMVYGKNIFYAILEMPYTQLRRQLYVIHSSHGKFVTEWHKQDGYLGLDYRQVRDGELDEIGRKRLATVAQDFKSTCPGRLYVWRPPEEVTVEDIRKKAEAFHHKYGCDGVIIDHMGLPKAKGRYSDTVSKLNSIVRDSKLMALNFARGRGVPVFGLTQMNRQGKMRADKNDGYYDMSAISYANEVEKSSDVITYTYLNDSLRKEGKFYLGNLKNRDNPIFERMIGKILWQSKRMRAIESDLIDMDTDRILAASEQLSIGVGEFLAA